MRLLFPRGINLDELARIQTMVAQRVIRRDGFGKLERIAGCDVSEPAGDEAWAACVVLDYASLKVLDVITTKVKMRFPYIPTFLAFRELEGMLRVAERADADLFMVGAHGVAHPRRAGLASHLGVVLDKPTIGVAKSLICGKVREPPDRVGSYTLVEEGGEVIGAAVRTRAGTKPIYVSVGHKVSLKTAIRISLQTCRGFRMPEPIRLAHMSASRAAKG